MKKYVYVVLRLVIIPMLFSGCSPERIIDVSSGEPILLLNYRQLIAEFIPSSLAGKYVSQVYRNFDGSKLFICVDSKLVFMDPLKTKIISAPADCSYLDRNEEFTVWFSDLSKGVFFKTGYVRPLKMHEFFGIDPSGTYFYISSFVDGYTIVYSTVHPELPLITIPRVAYSIFSDDSTIFLFENTPSENGGRHRDVCHKIVQNNGTYYVQSVVEIPGAVVDMSPVSKRLLLDNRSDSDGRWFLYDMETGEKKSISKRKDHGLFIATNLAALIESGADTGKGGCQ